MASSETNAETRVPHPPAVENATEGASGERQEPTETDIVHWARSRHSQRVEEFDGTPKAERENRQKILRQYQKKLNGEESSVEEEEGSIGEDIVVCQDGCSNDSASDDVENEMPLGHDTSTCLFQDLSLNLSEFAAGPNGGFLQRSRVFSTDHSIPEDIDGQAESETPHSTERSKSMVKSLEQFAKDAIDIALKSGTAQFGDRFSRENVRAALQAALDAATDDESIQQIAKPSNNTVDVEERTRLVSETEFELLILGEESTNLKELKRLQEVELFVLDNSLRETTVSAHFPHTLETKKEVLGHINPNETGLREVILGTFGAVRNVDDDLPEQWRKWGHSMNNVWGFTDIWDCSEKGLSQLYAGTVKTSDGLEEIVQYEFCNVILEADFCNPNLDYTKFDICDHIVHFVKEAKRRLQPRTLPPSTACETSTSPTKAGSPRVLVNLRDFTSFPTDHEGFRRALSAVKVLAQLAKKLRPIGLIFEEPSGLLLPETIGMLTRIIRKTMATYGWQDGKLLVHVHANFGNAEAGTLKALANGADGIWAAVCRVGAQLGHSCSAIVLANLARLGNKHVIEKYNIPKIVDAARAVHTICSMKHCDPLQEVYGSDAFNMVFGDGPMSTDGAMREIGTKLCGQQIFTRVSVFSTVAMIEDAMVERFGTAEECKYEKEVIPYMLEVCHTSLLRGIRFNFNSGIGLLHLYEMAAMRKTGLFQPAPLPMIKTELLRHKSLLARHPLIFEMRRHFLTATYYLLTYLLNYLLNTYTP